MNNIVKQQMIVNNEGLRATFKDGLIKLIAISTRQQAIKQLKILILQNKTTINLRIWLSVFAENRNKHSESQINILTFIIQQYGKGLLDPLDKVPSLEKTVFRITELLIKFFSQQTQNVALALQRAWVELYLTTLLDQDADFKKKLLYNNLQAILNGGADKISQMTAQFILDGLLQSSLNKEDIIFFKQIAKRVTVLFLKTTIIHPSTLTCLSTVLSYFNIINLVPLLQNIVNKVISYVAIAPLNSIGYKIKAEVCNVLLLIGGQLDQNGVAVQERVIKLLENLATDKVWAVQVTGRKALAVWKSKVKQWEQDYAIKNQQVFHYPTSSNFYNPSAVVQKPVTVSKWQKPQLKTAHNFNQMKEQEQSRQNPPKQPISTEYKFPDYSQGKYLHKNTGIGGGNTVQSAQQYSQLQRHQQTYSKKMEEIKKSIYQPKEEYTQYDETIPWEQAKNLPSVMSQNNKINKQASKIQETKNNIEYDDEKYLQNWGVIVSLYESGKKEESVKTLLQLDDDIYFLRFMLKYGKGLLKELTRNTSAKVLKQMLLIKKTNFMEQLFFKLVVESSKVGAGHVLTNQQNLEIIDKLEQCKKIQNLQKISLKLQRTYEQSLSL